MSKPIMTRWFKKGDHPQVRGTTYEEVSKLLCTSGCSLTGNQWNVLGIIDLYNGKLIADPGDWIVEIGSCDIVVTKTPEDYR